MKRHLYIAVLFGVHLAAAHAQAHEQGHAAVHAPSQTQAYVQPQAYVHAPAQVPPLCYEQAGSRYGVSPLLLQAIAQKESSLRPAVVNINTDGSRDLGLMQINSRWLPFLKSRGVSEADLYDPCTSLHVAAWILASNFRSMGLGWEAIGAYNARSPAKRTAYANDVLMRLRGILQQRAS